MQYVSILNSFIEKKKRLVIIYEELCKPQSWATLKQQRNDSVHKVQKYSLNVGHEYPEAPDVESKFM